MNITVLGAGAWGTALAKLLHESGHALTVWGHEPECLEEIRRAGRNTLFLPGIDLPRDFRCEPDPRLAVEGSDVVVAAVPSRPFRQVTACLADFRGIVVTVTKGIEFDTGLTMSGVLEQTAPHAGHCALSGPTLAMEVARGVPTAIVAASEQSDVAAGCRGCSTGRPFASIPAPTFTESNSAGRSRTSSPSPPACATASGSATTRRRR